MKLPTRYGPQTLSGKPNEWVTYIYYQYGIVTDMLDGYEISSAGTQYAARHAYG